MLLLSNFLTVGNKVSPKFIGRMSTFLLCLPNELLLHVFEEIDCPKSAVAFSQGNKRLQAVWLKYASIVAQASCNFDGSATNVAIKVAVHEAQTKASLDHDKIPPLRIWMPIFHHNISLHDQIRQEILNNIQLHTGLWVERDA
jgi:hypothetical protein